jgi:putative membrane protein
MTMKHLLLATCASALLGACSSFPPMPHAGGASSAGAAAPGGMAGAPAPARTATDYMAMAASGDLLEIQTSQMLLQRSQNAPLRAFAQQMTQDHPRLSQALMAAARSGGLTPPPPALAPRHAAMAKALEGTAPGQFDAAYVRLQVAAHEEALMLHRGYAASGDNASLKAAAASAVPIVQGHLQHAQALAAQAGRP